MLALIDGDVLKYACGFASDANAKAMGVEHEDLSYCLNTVSTTIRSICNVSESDDYVVVVSHPVNRRSEVYPDYKANRDPSHKPYWFNEINEYLFAKHDAIQSYEGDEADDMLGILQCASEQPTVICSIDKDLDGVPGLHYNFSKNRKKDGVYFVSEVQAFQFFYKQILTGDSTDNIPGMYKKLGIKASKRYTAPIDGMASPADMFSHVVDCYRGDTEFVKWVGDLLWIKREETGVWVPS